MTTAKIRDGVSVTGVFLATLLAVDVLLIGVHFAFALLGVGDYVDLSLAASGGFAERVLQGK